MEPNSIKSYRSVTPKVPNNLGSNMAKVQILVFRDLLTFNSGAALIFQYKISILFKSLAPSNLI